MLMPQHISVGRAGASCFAAVIGDITNLGIGAAIKSGFGSPHVAENAFDDNAATVWQSETPKSTASFIGWNWSAAPDTCRAIVRRVGLQQFKNATNGTYVATTAVLEVSDNLTDWTIVHTFNPVDVPGDTTGPLEFFDVPSPLLAAAARIRGTVFSGGGGSLPINVWNVAEAQFIENVS